MKLSTRALLALAPLFASAAPAYATAFDFSYVLNTGNTISGVLTGTLESNNNTVDLTGVQSISLNGVAVNQSFSLYSTDDIIFRTSAYSPTLTLNASYLDFAILDGSNNFVAFAVGDRTANYYGQNMMEASSGYGGDGNPNAYAPSSFAVAQEVPSGSLSQTAAVPEPASWAMMLIGFGFVGAALRGRRRMSAIA